MPLDGLLSLPVFACMMSPRRAFAKRASRSDANVGLQYPRGPLGAAFEGVNCVGSPPARWNTVRMASACA